MFTPHLMNHTYGFGQRNLNWRSPRMLRHRSKHKAFAVALGHFVLRNQRLRFLQQIVSLCGLGHCRHFRSEFLASPFRRPDGDDDNKDLFAAHTTVHSMLKAQTKIKEEKG